MNILITGGSGFIGSNIFYKLKKHHKIFIYDKLSPNFNANFIKGDLNQKKKLRLSLKKNNIDCIIHLAASLGVKDTENNPKKVLSVNIDGTKNLLEAIPDSKVKLVLFTSSSEIYGETNINGVKENDKLKPKSIYAHTKIIGEELVKTYSKIHNYEYLILRLFNVCGIGQKNEFVISKFINNANKKRLIYVYGSGRQIRCFCHVNDATDAIVKLIKSKFRNDIFNIGNNNYPISMIDLAKYVSKQFKPKIKIVKIPFQKSDRTQKREIYFRKPNLTKVKKAINYKPKINLKKIISEYIIRKLNKN